MLFEEKWNEFWICINHIFGVGTVTIISLVKASGKPRLNLAISVLKGLNILNVWD